MFPGILMLAEWSQTSQGTANLKMVHTRRYNSGRAWTYWVLILHPTTVVTASASDWSCLICAWQIDWGVCSYFGRIFGNSSWVWHCNLGLSFYSCLSWSGKSVTLRRLWLLVSEMTVLLRMWLFLLKKRRHCKGEPTDSCSVFFCKPYIECYHKERISFLSAKQRNKSDSYTVVREMLINLISYI